MKEIAREFSVVANRRLLAVLALLVAVCVPASPAPAATTTMRPGVELSRWGRQLTLKFQAPRSTSRTQSRQKSGPPPEFVVYRDGQEIGSGTFRYG